MKPGKFRDDIDSDGSRVVMLTNKHTNGHYWKQYDPQEAMKLCRQLVAATELCNGEYQELTEPNRRSQISNESDISLLKAQTLYWQQGGNIVDFNLPSYYARHRGVTECTVTSQTVYNITALRLQKTGHLWHFQRGSTMTATNNDHVGHNHVGHNHDGHKPWRPTWWNLSNDVKCA